MKRLIIILAIVFLYSCSKEAQNTSAELVGTWKSDSSYNSLYGKNYYTGDCRVVMSFTETELTETICLFGNNNVFKAPYTIDKGYIVRNGERIRFEHIAGKLTTYQIEDNDTLIYWFSK